MRDVFDAVVIGSGPNGLTAAATLTRAGRRVLVLEAGETIGGGARTDDALGAGTARDVCSAVHPTGFVSPAFADLRLTDHGLRWIVPDVAVAHVGDGDVIAIGNDCVAEDLGVDADRWRALVTPSADPRAVAADVFAMPGVPRRLVDTARFAAAALAPVDVAVRALRTERARAAFAAIAAHASRPLSAPGSSAAGLLLGMLTVTGWPVAQGGSQAIVDALASIVTAGGGRIETGVEVTSLDQLPTGCDLFFDTSPAVLLDVLGDRLPRRYGRALRRFRYGTAVCKVDYLLREEIPWAHRPETMARTATFHVASSLDEIRRTEADVAAGRVPQRPWVLGGEPTRVDPSRAPAGTHLAWAYCHVPAGCDVDMTAAITHQIERRAPGFTDTVVASTTTTGADLAAYDANYVGGDINCGAASLRQLLARPVLSPTPQVTGLDGVYLCSSATSPGGGVHGMSGYRAAQAALRIGRRASG